MTVSLSFCIYNGQIRYKIDTNSIGGDNYIGCHDINNVIFEYIKPDIIANIINHLGYKYWTNLSLSEKQLLWDKVYYDCEYIKRCLNNKECIYWKIEHQCSFIIQIKRSDILRLLEPMYAKIYKIIHKCMYKCIIDVVICTGEAYKSWFIKMIITQLMKQYRRIDIINSIIYKYDKHIIATGTLYVCRDILNTKNPKITINWQLPYNIGVKIGKYQQHTLLFKKSGVFISCV